MSELKLDIPNELKERIDSLPDLDWSELVRRFLSDEVKKELLLKKLDKLLENSELTDEECIKLGREAKKGRFKELQEKGMV